MRNNYIVDEHGNAVLCRDSSEWRNWMGKQRLRFNKATRVGDSLLVSTIFAGMNLDPCSCGACLPRLWETAVFRLDREGKLIEPAMSKRVHSHSVARAIAIHEDQCKRTEAERAKRLSEIPDHLPENVE